MVLRCVALITTTPLVIHESFRHQQFGEERPKMLLRVLECWRRTLRTTHIGAVCKGWVVKQICSKNLSDQIYFLLHKVIKMCLAPQGVGTAHHDPQHTYKRAINIDTVPLCSIKLMWLFSTKISLMFIRALETFDWHVNLNERRAMKDSPPLYFSFKPLWVFDLLEYDRHTKSYKQYLRK